MKKSFLLIAICLLTVFAQAQTAKVETHGPHSMGNLFTYNVPGFGIEWQWSEVGGTETFPIPYPANFEIPDTLCQIVVKPIYNCPGGTKVDFSPKEVKISVSPVIDVDKIEVWDSKKPFNFHDFWTMPVASNQVNWYVKDRQSGDLYQVPEDEETAYFFNMEGRDEWGVVEIVPMYICPHDNEEIPFIVEGIDKLQLEVYDYGFYFINDDGSKVTTRKFLKEHYNEDPSRYQGYIDPAKPTLVYIHGKQPGAIAIHKRTDLTWTSVFVDGQEPDPFHALKLWIDRGWNVAVYFWSQTADNPFADLNSTVKGIWDEVHWKREDGSYSNEAVSDPAGTLLAKDFEDIHAIGLGTTNNPIRPAAASLGTHLITKAVVDLYALNSSSANIERVIYLDPAFGRDVQAAFREYVLPNPAHFPHFEFYYISLFDWLFSGASSGITSPPAGARDYKTIRQMYELYPVLRLWARWNENYNSNVENLHSAVTPWYLGSIRNKPSHVAPELLSIFNQPDGVGCPPDWRLGQGPIGASQCFPIIDDPGDVGYEKGLTATTTLQNSKSLAGGFYNQVDGVDTFTPEDDYIAVTSDYTTASEDRDITVEGLNGITIDTEYEESITVGPTTTFQIKGVNNINNRTATGSGQTFNETFEDNQVVEELYDVLMYPNPSVGEVTFRVVGEAVPQTVTVFNANGKLIYHRKWPANLTELKLDTYALPEGMYIIHLESAKSKEIKRLLVN